MLYIDLILVVILLYFFIKGWQRGLIQVIGGIFGIIAGSYLATYYGKSYDGFEKFLIFTLIFIVANRLAALIFYLLDRFFNFVAVIPGLRGINRIAGGLAGLIEGVVLISIILYVAQRLDFIPLVKQMMEQTQLAKPLAAIGGMFLPLFRGLF